MTSQKRARVLHLIKGLDAGGAETLLAQTVRTRNRDRFDYQVAYLLAGHDALLGQIEAADVTVTCLAGSPWWDPRWILRLRRLLVDQRFDVIHSHSPLLATGGRLVARSLRANRRPKVVTTVHNMWASHHWAVRGLDRVTWRLDDCRLAVSEAVRRSLPGRAPARAETVIHGIDVAKIRGEANRDAARSELSALADQVVVGTVANLRSNKAYPDLIAAAAVVLASAPKTNFVSIGSGPLLAQLERQRDEAGLATKLQFMGQRPDAAVLISGFDIFCLSSHFEGLPVALMEALVTGIPVVVTDVGGMAELVEDGIEGRVVPAGQPDQLAAAILDLISDPERRLASANAARARGDHLDAASATSTIEARYLDLVGSQA